jgi:lipoprotein NlpD
VPIRGSDRPFWLARSLNKLLLWETTLSGLKSAWQPLLKIAALLLAFVQIGCVHRTVGLPFFGQALVLEQKKPVKGLYHTVAKGEDLAAIAKAHKVDAQQLAEVNNLNAPYAVEVGARIFIPEVPAEETPTRINKGSREEAPVSDFKGRLTWPVDGPIVSEFGVRSGAQYNGIGIRAPEGTQVHVAAEGRVGHVGSLPGYGNLVLVEHADRLVTVYAHLKDISVKEGDTVKQGTAIGTVGTSGRVEGPRLYFEVRARSKPRNPLFFLERKP